MSLSDIITPTVIELGKIKIGGKGETKTSAKGNPFRRPVKFDHFIVTTMNRTAQDDLEPDKPLMDDLRERYGSPDGLLRRIPIVLMSNDIDDVLQSSYVWYDGKRVAARSDGKTLTVYKSLKTGQWLDKPETKPWSDDMLELSLPGKPDSKLFKQHTIFSCVIASKLGRWGGVYKFRTTSKITASQLYSSLLRIQKLTGGILMGMPLQLVVRPLKVNPNGISSTVYVVHVELVGEDIQQLRNQALELARSEYTARKEIQDMREAYRRLLTAPGHETDPQEIEDIQAEFSPDLPDAPTEPVSVSNRLRHKLGVRPSESKPVIDAEFTIELEDSPTSIDTPATDE